MSKDTEDIQKYVTALKDIEENGENSKYYTEKVGREIQIKLKPTGGNVYFPTWIVGILLLIILAGAVQWVLNLF